MFIFSQCQRLGSPRSKFELTRFLVGALLLPCRWLPSSVSLHGCRSREGSLVFLLIRTHILSDQGFTLRTLFNLTNFHEVSVSNTVTLGGGTSTYECSMDGGTFQSTAGPDYWISLYNKIPLSLVNYNEYQSVKQVCVIQPVCIPQAIKNYGFTGFIGSGRREGFIQVPALLHLSLHLLIPEVGFNWVCLVPSLPSLPRES